MSGGYLQLVRDSRKAQMPPPDNYQNETQKKANAGHLTKNEGLVAEERDQLPRLPHMHLI